MNEWIQDHLTALALFVAASCLGFIKWLVAREIKRLDGQLFDHEERLRQHEGDRVTHKDMDELRMSLMASIDLRHAENGRRFDAIQSDLRIVLDHLLGRKT